VLFDMDGVLVDSFEMWFHAMNEVAADLGVAPIPRPALEAAFGQGIEDDLRGFFAGCRRADLERAYEATLPRHAHRMTVNPRAAEVLADLGARGLGRAIVTNTGQDAVPPLLARLGLDAHVDVVVGAHAGLSEKPAPDMVLAACEALDVTPAEARFVGDSDYDRRAADAAGVSFLHYEMRSGADLAAALGDR
jgi:phosphoglycolate phosphatase/AHBA synthesis associated protein